ncbi:unnamed protein product [Dicrocoelium dendriticum]|nr:unnamed protein product [Dicrocoelium dendriticum]
MLFTVSVQLSLFTGLLHGFGVYNFNSSFPYVDMVDAAVGPSNAGHDVCSTSELRTKVIAEQNDPETLDDVPFTVKIVPSHSEPFELQVSSFELVQEIYRVLVDREETCSCTCFSLALNGQTLDMFAELKAIEGLKDGSEIRVIEGRYTVREAKNHVKHVHDLLNSIEPCDAYAGKEQMSLTFVSLITGDLERKGIKSRPDSCIDFAPPEFILPGYCSNGPHDLPLSPLHPTEHDGKPLRCVRQLNYSNWNPPPTSRRLLGDLVYLFFHTLEDKRYHITACSRGFYVNMSTEDEFHPHPVQHAYVAHSLVDLLKQLSPGFKRNFETLLKRRASKHPFERVPSPYQVYSWLAPSFKHTPDSIRKEEAFSSRMACEENLPGQTRDWNEELQVTRELPQSRLTERLLRDRAIFKSNSDFVAAATRAAMSVVNGDILAINPGETRKQQMFIWNNMFFSLGFDVKDHYKQFGGEHAAYVATSSDLSGVRAYSMLDQAGLHTLGTAIIDYHGFRVTAQTIIPGILEKEQEQLVVYGSIDFGKTVVTDRRYEELLSKTAQQLKIRPHKVLNQNGDEVQLYSSVDCKGIVGNDGRTYILDLLRTFPPDLNYFGTCPQDLCPKLSPSLTQFGYPYQHRHLLCTLRQELIEAFFEHRHEAFLRSAVLEIQKIKDEYANIATNNTNEASASEVAVGTSLLHSLQESVNQESAPNHEDTKAQTSVFTPGLFSKKPLNPSHSDNLLVLKKLLNDDSAVNSDLAIEAIQVATRSAGSVYSDRFELAFNPDICQKFVKFPDSERDALEADKNLVIDACDFLVTKQIPAFVRDCYSLYISPQDGHALIEVLHQRGINVRYLNRVVELIDQKPSLVYLKRIAITELLIRSTKHIFKNYLQEVDPMLVSVSVAHFLNCFLTSCQNLTPLAGINEQVLKLNRNKKNKKKSRNVRESSEEMSWISDTPATLWADIVKEAKEYYHYQISAPDIDAFCAQFEIQRTQILRSFCSTVGIQLLLRDYQLTPPNGAKHHTRPVFFTEDILSLYPIVKHLHPHATDAYHYFTTGQARISSGHLQEGFELINEALNLLNAVYGPLHPDIGACNRLLARLSYVMSEHQAALLFQHRATMISERVHGIDNPTTVTEYTNIGLMLQIVGEFDLALVFLENALDLSKVFYGERNLKEAFTCHLISRTYTYRGDFRSALAYEKRRFAIYKERLGPDSDYTRDSDECLRNLTQQAVTRAKKVAELVSTSQTNGVAAKNTSSGVVVKDDDDADTGSSMLTLRSLLPGPLSPYNSGIPMPTLSSILETLNRVNGILVIHLRTQDAELSVTKNREGRISPKVLKNETTSSGANLNGQCAEPPQSSGDFPGTTVQVA